MDHTKALNLILANECPKRSQGNLSEFVIELCCVTVRVIAKFTGSRDGEFTYDVVKLEFC